VGRTLQLLETIVPASAVGLVRTVAVAILGIGVGIVESLIHRMISSKLVDRP
jgi:hypothetical protein